MHKFTRLERFARGNQFLKVVCVKEKVTKKEGYEERRRGRKDAINRPAANKHKQFEIVDLINAAF